MSSRGIAGKSKGRLSIVAVAALAAVFLLGYASSPVGPTVVWADTFTVTSDDDTDDGTCGAHCSLREAINAANAEPGNDTIVFDDGVTEITLANMLPQIQAGGLTIDGEGVVTVDGNGNRVFYVEADASLTLLGITVTNGAAPHGGGIYNAGELTIIDSEIVDNEAFADGGGIFSDRGSALSITGSLIERNTAGGFGVLPGTGGGGIYGIGAELTIADSTIRLNEVNQQFFPAEEVGDSAADGFGGGGIYVVASILDITGSDILENSVDATEFLQNAFIGIGGGGIYGLESSVSISGSAVNANQVLFSPSMNGAQISVSYDAGIGGGGIYAAEGLLRETGTASHEPGHIEITDSIIDGNLAEESDGGGLYVGFGVELTLLRSTVSNNDSTMFEEGEIEIGGYGGGLYLGGVLGIPEPATGFIENVTFSGNFAEDAGGGIYIRGEGEADISFSTFSENESPEGAAIGTGDVIPIDPILLTLLANIIANSIGGDNCDFDEPTEVESLGYNIEDQNTCELDHATDETGIDPLLGPLADNGGFAPTHMLLIGSPAIDFVDASVCPPPATDERLVERPQDGDNDGTFLCDSGAFELESSAAVLTVTKACPMGTGNATFNVLVDGEANVYACGTSLNYGVAAGDVTITEIISGPDSALYATSIDCDDESGTAGTSHTVTIEAGVDVTCTVTNVFADDGLTPEEIADLLELNIQIEILNILNNINQNVNTNDNDNTNNNVNENTQNQTNDQDTNVTTGDVNVSSGGGAGTGIGEGTGSLTRITPPNTGSAGMVSAGGGGLSSHVMVAAISLLGTLSLAALKLAGVRH